MFTLFTDYGFFLYLYFTQVRGLLTCFGFMMQVSLFLFCNQCFIRDSWSFLFIDNGWCHCLVTNLNN